MAALGRRIANRRRRRLLNTDRYARALTFSARAHAGQVRKGTEIPYITHPLAVSALVVEFGSRKRLKPPAS